MLQPARVCSIMFCWFALASLAWAADDAPVAVENLARANTERNLRWILERERLGEAANARVGVYADAGVWHDGARAIVAALEKSDVTCRVLDRTRLTGETLRPLDAVVLPGGWAPSQWESAGEAGLANIRRYVEAGGRCVGVCAGAYLLAREVRYDGKTYPYPLGLFDGVANGPVPGLAPYPEPGTARLTLTAAGEKRGLKPLAGRNVYYSGGPSFSGGTGTEVLARYADGSAAAIARPVGKGEIVLIGVHAEIVSDDSAEHAITSEMASSLYRSFCGLKADK